MKKYHIITLGCKVNSYESEAMGEILQSHGYEYNPLITDNDVVIINTCSVTHVGDAKSRKMIRKAIKASSGAVGVVVGCYSQLFSDVVKKIEGVNIVIGTRNRENIFEYINRFEKTKEQIVDIYEARVDEKFDFLKVTSYSENTRAYLKIQDGCNNFCNYCIIPYTRGALRSRAKDEIIQEAHQLVKNGFLEIVLTGIHTAGYGDDFVNYSFTDLIEEMLLKVNGLKRLRISSIEASQINERLIKLLQDNPIVVNHLHIPLQSGVDSILKRMNRKYNTAHYESVINELRSKVQDIAITTDVIVGFPGESEEEFNKTYEFIKKIKFSALHVFPYSRRSGTPASRMANQVDEKIKAYRVDALVNLSKELHKEYASQFLKQNLKVLFETYDENGMINEGHTTNYLKVKVKDQANLRNQIVEVKLLTLNEDGSINGEISQG